jgi:two-component system chemotaxis response regulator CheB
MLVADPRASRRKQLVHAPGGPLALEAASLLEAFPIAEEAEPAIIALSVDFLAEPELEGLLRLANMLGSEVFLFSADGRSPAPGTIGAKLPCLALRPGENILDLAARMADPQARRDATEGNLRPPDLILIGASTGGVAAIETVLMSFPADCPPTLVVQHIRDGFVQGLIRRLDNACRPRVMAAADGARLSRGVVYFAAETARHLTVGRPTSQRCGLVDAPPRNGHCPAVDPLFESALSWGPRVAAALLTGMGADGAAGMGLLRRAGAHTIAQDQGSSVVWGMPRAAVEAGAAEEVLPIDRIGSALLAARPRPTPEDARRSAQP